MSRRRARQRNPILETFGVVDFVQRQPVLAIAVVGTLVWALAPKQAQQAVSTVAPGVTLPPAPSWLQTGAQRLQQVGGA